MKDGINLLRAAIEKPTKQDYLQFSFFILLTLLAYFFIPGFLALIIGGSALIFFSVRLRLAWYIMSAVAFVTGWQISISFDRFDEIINLPFRGGITAPLGDIVSLAVFGIFVVSVLIGVYRIKLRTLSALYPAGIWYSLFIVTASISAYLVYHHGIGASFKYVARPMIFSYLIFMVVPILLIREWRTLFTTFVIWLLVGLGISFYGLSSFFMVSSGGLPRAVPYPLFGLTPFGMNHNLLAEPLVAIIPVAFFLMMLSFRHKSVWFPALRASVVFMTLIALLTLSRAAWLALFLEGCIFAWFHRESVVPFITKMFRARVVPVVLSLAVLGYMGVFLASSIVTSSNASRRTMIDIAVTYAQYKPWLGYGPGTFIQLMGETTVFVMEYGEPLDAHGFIQKIVIETGLIGLFFFVVFLVVLFRSLAKKQDVVGDSDYTLLAQCMLMMAIGAVTFQLFNTSYFLSTMWLPLGVAVAALQLRREH